MAKGLSPVIGLAVVVALALAAVFGAMSLANPVQAQTPANTAPSLISEDRVEITVYTGHRSESIDVSDYFKDGSGIGEITQYTVAFGSTDFELY